MVLGQRVEVYNGSSLVGIGWYAGNSKGYQLASGIFFVEVNRYYSATVFPSTSTYPVDKRYKPHYKTYPKYFSVNDSYRVIPGAMPKSKKQPNLSHSFEVSTVRRNRSVKIGDVWIRSVDKSVEKKSKT